MSEENTAANVVGNQESVQPEAEKESGNEQQTQTQEGQGQQEAKPERFSRQHKVYLRQQEELRKEQEAWKAKHLEEQNQLSEQRKELEQYRQWKEQITKGDPWTFLKQNNLDLNQLYQLALKDEQDPRTIAANVRKEIESKYDAQFKELEDKRKQQAQAEWEAKIAGQKQQVLGVIGQYLKDNAETYECCNAYPGAQELVLDVIWESYRANPESALGYEQAAQAVENWIEEQEIKTNPLLKLAKARNFLSSDGKQLDKKDDKRSSARDSGKSKHPSSGKQSTQPRSVTSKMTHATAPSARPADETFEEKKERLSEAWRKGEFRPGMH